MKLSNTLTFLLASFLLISALPACAKDFRGDSIYQIFTDRFCDGDPKNNDPKVSAGMFDAEKKNWHAYWGGDLAGIRSKLKYISDMGFSAIWISPVIDNVNKPTIDGNGVKFAPYHGYHARDFRAIDEHIGDWKEFDKLIDACHKQGIKVLVDMPLNHTSSINHGEYGALYSGTEFMSDTENDRNKYFHHLPEIKDWNDPYQLQYHTLAWLGDLNQESTYVHNYLIDAVLKLQKHGADGTRLDAAKHANWGWQHVVTNRLANKDEHFVVAEWWMSDTNDPIYKDGVKFANKAGTAMFDFPFSTAVRKVLGSDTSASFKLLSDTIEQEYKDFNDCNGLVTFIDNHDMPRFLSLNKDKKNLHMAIALLFTSRGIPCFYYGTEQYLHDDTKGGGDPYTRVWMSSFDTDSEGVKLVSLLNKARASNIALRFGKQETLFVSKDCYVFRRRFGDERAIVAVNKGDKPVEVDDILFGHVPVGVHEDMLAGKLGGKSFKVDKDQEDRDIKIPIAPGSVSIWTFDNAVKSSAIKPAIGSVIPSVINSGVPVSIRGKGFGVDRGKVVIGGETVSPSHWADEKVTFNAPSSARGIQRAFLVTADGKKSDSFKLSVYAKKLVPITFVVKNPPMDMKSEKLFITGSCASLGEWSVDENEIAGPMLYSEDRDYILTVPLPASSKVSLKLLIKDSHGKVMREKKDIYSFKVEAEGPWRHEVKF